MLTIVRLISERSSVTQPQSKSRNMSVSDRSFGRGLLARCSIWSLLIDLLVKAWQNILGGHFLSWHFAAELHYLYDPNHSFHFELALPLLKHRRSFVAVVRVLVAF